MVRPAGERPPSKVGEPVARLLLRPRAPGLDDVQEHRRPALCGLFQDRTDIRRQDREIGRRQKLSEER